MVEIVFWSESIQNSPKRILKWKSRFRKKKIILTFLWGHSHFCEKWRSKKWRKIKKNLRLKIFEKPLFLAIFDRKLEKSSEPAELNRRREACNSSKWPQYNPNEMGDKNFKKNRPKNKKMIFGQKMTKNGPKIKNFSKKNFFDRNWFRMVQNVFWNKNVDFENFSHRKFFSVT